MPSLLIEHLLTLENSEASADNLARQTQRQLCLLNQNHLLIGFISKRFGRRDGSNWTNNTQVRPGMLHALMTTN
jgi:hypothetical protein